VRFGLECAILNLIADSRNRRLEGLLCSNPIPTLPVNGLLTGDADEVLARATELIQQGYRSLKLKVGNRTIEDDIALTRQVCNLLPAGTTLRLDANRARDVEDALAFGTAVVGPSIDYIEEPCASCEPMFGTSIKPAVPVALDETLFEIEPEELSSFAGVKAVVLKPTMLGLERTMKFVRAARELGLMTVVSSSFESRVGLTCLSRLAACINTPGVAAGLGTEDWFADNLIDRPIVNSLGSIDIAHLPNLADSIREQCLEDITDA